MSQENSIFEVIKDKVFFSRISGAMAEVVEKIPDQPQKGKVYFDGITLIDCIDELEDDIQQMTTITQYGHIVNLEDYYHENGAFDKEGNDRFFAALDELMTKQEYAAYEAYANAPTEIRIKTFFENQNKEHDHCDWVPDGIESYSVNEDGSVDVKGNVYIDSIDLIDGHLPFKFGKVDGIFECDGSDMTSLWGCPDVVDSYFSVEDCPLKSLDGCPREVGSFFCNGSEITSLQGCPQVVGGDFCCNYSQSLLSLEGSPSVIHGFFECHNNPRLTSLKGGPKIVEGDYLCQECDLRTLEGAPTKVKGDFDCSYNNLENMDGTPVEIGGTLISDYD